MNNKKCARCEKTVYPIEELKCLDKAWHKTCFKCYECGMILNMKTYKGFNKLPYCNAHCPQARATTVADTPEARRLAENTKIQSQVKYHEEFEKQKGKLTQVADDPETLRIRNTSKIISNATYHGEYEKKKQMEERRNLLSSDNVVNNNMHQPQYIGHSVGKESKATKSAAPYNNNPHQSPSAASIDNYQPRNVYYINNNGNQIESSQDFYKTTSTKVSAPPPNYPASNANYVADPRYGNAPMYQHHMAMPGYQHQMKQPAQYHPQVVQQYRSAYHDNAKYYPAMQHPVQKPVYSAQNLGRCFRAIYDYTAQDTDEVSFVDGDLIINCQPIDDGWMTGTVQRTGKTGMLPSNYVESA